MDKMQKMIDWIIKHRTLLLIVAVAVLLICVYNIGNRVATKQQAQENPAAVTQEQTQDAKALQQQLDISRKNADELRRELAAAQAGQRAPAATYYVNAPTVERAAQDVEKQIKADDPTLPLAARERTDRTVVAPIVKDKDGKELPPEQQKVDVYKINLRKDHRIKAGATMVDGKAYATVGYEQGRFEALVHFDGAQVRGGSVMYNIVEW
nr:MAG TPA: hypothetical protein [Caudoviricetes sp.]